MSFRPVVLGSLALVVVFSPPSRRASVTTKYKIETKNETSVDLSAFGQPNQEATIRISAWVAVTVGDTVGGRTAHVVVDSIKLESTTPQLTQASADSAKGGTIHGFVDAAGKVNNLTPTPADNAVMLEVQGVIHTFFPKLKNGARTGDHWIDTVDVNTTSAMANTKSKFVVTYTSAGQETVGGVSAIKLTTSSTSTTTGTVESPMAGTMQVEASSTGTGVYFVAPDGRYLGGNAVANSDQKLTMAMAPAPIPVKSTRTVTVTLVP
jgi:hypothetical protein